MSASDLGKIEARRLVPYGSQLRKLTRALGSPLEHPERLMDEVQAGETSGRIALGPRG